MHRLQIIKSAQRHSPRKWGGWFVFGTPFYSTTTGLCQPINRKFKAPFGHCRAILDKTQAARSAVSAAGARCAGFMATRPTVPRRAKHGATWGQEGAPSPGEETRLLSASAGTLRRGTPWTSAARGRRPRRLSPRGWPERGVPVGFPCGQRVGGGTRRDGPAFRRGGGAPRRARWRNDTSKGVGNGYTARRSTPPWTLSAAASLDAER